MPMKMAVKMNVTSGPDNDNSNNSGTYDGIDNKPVGL